MKLKATKPLKTDQIAQSVDRVRDHLVKQFDAWQKDCAEELLVLLRVSGRKRGRGEKVNWDSERQRRAYFASGGFGGGIPYQRTGEYVRAWKLQRDSSSGQAANYLVVNPVAYASYVTGDPVANYPQSRIHRGRWQSAVGAIKRVLNGATWRDGLKRLSIATKDFTK